MPLVVHAPYINSGHETKKEEEKKERKKKKEKEEVNRS